MNIDFALVLENAAWPALTLDDAGVIKHANAAARSIFGRFADVEAPAAAIWSPLNALSLEALLSGVKGTEGPITLKFVNPGGESISFNACISSGSKLFQRYFLLQLFREFPLPLRANSAAEPAPIGTSVKLSDLPPELARAHKQKLECALQLTRTVALDFNNALTIILGHTSLILSRMEPNHVWRSSLLEVEKSAEKAAEVASDLAAFSRQEKETPSPIGGNLNDLIRRTVELFQRPGRQDLIWTFQLEPKLYTAAFEETKMQQAFVKILDNAVQAITQSGYIIVRTRNQEVHETLQEGNVRLTPGHYVCVEFEDNGCGIARDVLPKIFEPFFTTKASPKHRGLGLAWVYGIVTNHGGNVSVVSQPGRGTIVRIFLPAQAKIVRDLALQSGDLQGTETILMVDDEELLLTMGEMVLSSFGYRVLTANSGHKALELFSQKRGEIDLVITDLVMPKMSGREFVYELRRLAPNVKIICSSGYIRALGPDEEELYLQKPFTSLDLLRKVREALTHADAS